MNQIVFSKANYCTVAAYYLYGMEAGVVSLQDAKDWAFSIIEFYEQPPAEIIAIGMSSGLPETIENLNAVPGDRDAPLAGSWLLAMLRKELESDPSKARRIVQQAMQIARSTDLRDEHYTFDLIDDMFSLAETQTYGTIEQCLDDLTRVLAKYKDGVENTLSENHKG